MAKLHTYKVEMQEIQRDGSLRTLHQTACATSEAEVVKFYGLTEPDIVSYSIKEVSL